MNAYPSMQGDYARTPGISAYPQLWRGLVGAWPFGMQQSSDRARDFSNRGSHGTLVGPVWSTGKFSRALLFNGTSNYVDLGTAEPLNLTTSVTISCWAYPTLFTGSNRSIYTSGNTGNSYYVFWFDSTGIIRFQNDGTGGSIVGSTLSLNTWYHLVAMVNADSGQGSIFVNGNLNVSGGMTIPGATGIKRIGSRLESSTNAHFFSGLLGDVMIYNRALSREEVRVLYRNPYAPWIRIEYPSVTAVSQQSAAAMYYYSMT